MNNLTPHAISIYDDDFVVEIPPTFNRPLRLKLEQEKVSTIRVEGHTIPVFSAGKPSKEAIRHIQQALDTYSNGGTEYVIVPTMLLPYVPDSLKPVVFAPDTGPDSVVRNEEGRIVGVRRLLCAQ